MNQTLRAGSQQTRAASILNRLREVRPPLAPEIALLLAHPGSRLSRLAACEGDSGDEPPYWAFAWPGGLALARYILDRPYVARDRRVLDLGAGSGLVAIAAAKAGARAVLAAETSAWGRAAIALNANANGVTIETIGHDLMAGPPPDAELILVGDLFYEQDLAERTTRFLDTCLAAGAEALIGDLGRADLPFSRLKGLAEYPVADIGDGGLATPRRGGVFAFARALG